MRVSNTLVISWLFWMGAWGASAQADDSADRAEAKKLFDEAQVHYAVGRFPEALEDYSRAYELAQLPGFLFNIGQCHRELQDYERALFFFEGYLRDKPDAKNRRVVEDLIVEARRKAAEQEEERRRNLEIALKLKAERLRKLELARQADETPVNASKPLPRKLSPAAVSRPNVLSVSEPSKAEPAAPFYEKWWFWTIVGGAVAAATAGTIYALSSGGKAELPSGSLGTVDLR